jgi:hypothetical protein
MFWEPMMDHTVGQSEESLVVRSARARQHYWIAQRDAARTAKDHRKEQEAQRFIDEYDDFVTLLLREAEVASASRR